MKLEIARGLFLLGAVGVTCVAAAAWHEPKTQVIAPKNLSYCPLPAQERRVEAMKTDEDLLLFMFGLTQGARSQS
ncbi:hypothetical protein [Pseudomonas sp. 5P_3.1_Bac2]|uniref:hypothetical protein n=1 Tax=Pseudomonas sp. 5P_3.1_Bac2 TaxID=2971617 RepID=UPI0021C6AACB|nr:hypothetical protein [Pseudomonas sp. 5P_3.1_Bac2]MCU1717590.1 hypothetical protein [Pseudomonas sp. 5P_3.1_Bac2]